MAKTERIPPPRRISNRVTSVNLTGYVFPWVNDQPLLMRVLGSGGDLFFPLFSTIDKLVAALTPTDYSSIKQIDDSVEFLDSIPRTAPSGVILHIIIDFYRIEDGMVRYTEVFRLDDPLPEPS